MNMCVYVDKRCLQMNDRCVFLNYLEITLELLKRASPSSSESPPQLFSPSTCIEPFGRECLCLLEKFKSKAMESFSG